MRWVTWDQAAIIALAGGVIALTVRRFPYSRFRATVIAAAQELTLMAVLYAIWRLARVLPLDQSGGAIERARQINQLQRDLHFPSELSLQHFVLNHEWLARLNKFYYAVAHVPATLIFLVWLFSHHRSAYPQWRNCLAILTGLCLIIRFIRVAPESRTSLRPCRQFMWDGPRSFRSVSSLQEPPVGDGRFSYT